MWTKRLKTGVMALQYSVSHRGKSGPVFCQLDYRRRRGGRHGA
jgi:hypothetical protein